MAPPQRIPDNCHRQPFLGREFTRLHREASDRVTELSAVCSLQEELARGFAAPPGALMHQLLTLILLHLQADLVAWLPPATSNPDDPPYTIAVAPGIPAPDPAAMPFPPDNGRSIIPITNHPCCGRYYPLTTADGSAGTMVIGHRREAFFTPARERFIGLLQQQIQNAILLLRQAGARERESRRRFALRRYFSADIAAAIEAGETSGLNLTGRRLTVTILCADIRGFSRLAEQHGEKTVVAVLNRLYRMSTEVIFAHRGTIDKFAGDGLLAVFGAPVQRTDDHYRAVAAAIALQHRWQSAAATTASETPGSGETNRPDIAVALHRGPVIAGRLGTEELLTYTVIGDPVNTCHRLVSLAPPGSIIASREAITVAGGSAVKAENGTTFVWRPFRTAAPLRGMTKRIDLFYADREQSPHNPQETPPDVER
jgi:class 3 adenylate cyclase